MPDIVGTIQSAPLVDLCLVVIYFAAFVMGYIEGPIRRVLGFLATLLAFVIAANLKDNLGAFLSDYWTQLPPEYDHLLAFGILFAVLLVVFSIAIQAYYKRLELFPRHQVAEELLGGVAGLLEATLMIAIAVVIFSSYTIPAEAFPREGDALRMAQDALVHQSNIAAAIRDSLVPPLMTGLSAFLPGDLVRLFV